MVLVRLPVALSVYKMLGNIVMNPTVFVDINFCY